MVNYILNKITKPSLIPKLNLSKGIPKELSTFVVIPSIIKSKEKVKELIKKLEVYYLANKSENIYFAVLGDASESQNELESFDDEVIETGLEEVEKLNQKYAKRKPLSWQRNLPFPISKKNMELFSKMLFRLGEKKRTNL